MRVIAFHAPLALAISVLASLAAIRDARAGDLAAVVFERCKTNSEPGYARRVQAGGRDARTARDQRAAFHELCVSPQRVDWAKYQNQQYPQQFFLIQYGVDVCAKLSLIADDQDMKESAAVACGTQTTRETAAGGFAETGINIVLGLGEFLQAEAKQEALEYLLERIGKKFCQYTFTIDVPAGSPPPNPPDPRHTIALGVWFKNSCVVMLPDGAIDVDAFSFGALKAAFKTDLRALPQNIAVPAQAWIEHHWPGGESYLIAIGVAMYILYDVLDGKTPLEMLDELGDRADGALKGKLKCDLTTRSKMTKECVLVLGFELARTSANEYAKDKTTPPSRMIGDAIDKFCTDYGATGFKELGECVISKDDYEKWHVRILAIYRAIKRLHNIDRTMAAMSSSATHDEISKRVAPELGHAVRGLTDALTGAAADGLPEDRAKITEDIALLGLAFDAFDAVIGDDPAALGRAVLAVLGSKMGKKHLDPDLVHALTVVVALASAKDREEVKSILKDVTAPVGTYKRKYGAEHPIITLNGFVGFFAGEELRLHSRNAAGSYHDPVSHRAPLKLAAPVGIDFSLASGGECWRFWRSGTCNHVGIALTLIDPLALAVSTAGDTVSAEWKTLFEPGLYLRFGVLHSPFTLAVGGNYQWARRSDERCGRDRCFDGAFQLGALLSVDVPLLVLR
jgi:hypothetical protein